MCNILNTIFYYYYFFNHYSFTQICQVWSKKDPRDTPPGKYNFYGKEIAVKCGIVFLMCSLISDMYCIKPNKFSLACLDKC